MRLLVLFLVCSIGLSYAADSYAQKALISIDVHNQRVEDVLKEIEEQSDFDFFFNNKHVDLNRRVSVSADKSNIFSVLKEIFSGTNVKYSVLDKKIILSVEAQSPQQEQKITVSGTILDAQGEPIIGASVLEKGVQGNGTITDIDGIFKLSVSSSKAQLEVSYIGYQSQTVAVQPGRNMKITLQEDSKQLDEVVVVGYGTQSKKTLTGAVSMVNMGDVEMNTVPNVSRALAGKAAGFRVNQVSAQPGGEAKFRIRGEASISAGNEPLFVIDGFPVSSSGSLSSGDDFYKAGNIDNVLESLNPDDIESISVLKDAASTAIYGARAGHGVVLITTKRGKSQKPRVTYSGMGSVQVARSNYKMLDTRMYMDMYNKQRYEEWLKLNGQSVIGSKKFQESKYDLPIVLGKTITNEVFMFDLCKMPHVLVAGATGQGKSVGLNAIITSLLYKKHPAELKFVLVDPKKVEFSIYSVIENHFLAKLPDGGEPIITDVTKVVQTLNSVCVEMDTRYDLLKMAHVRNIREYNEKFINRRLNPEKGHKFMPYIVVVIDEFGDLIMTAGKEVELPIARIAQLARAVGIHMIIATQRPTTNIITGTIKANFPARIAFRVSAMMDSRTILDRPGANRLIGKGDMLFLQGADPVRVQCAFIDTPEVEEITKFIARQQGYPTPFFLPEYVSEDSNSEVGDIDMGRLDPLFEDAARLVVIHQQGSTSLIQRKFAIGYNRAGRIMDQLEKAGIVGPTQGSKARDVLCIDDNDLEMRLNNLQ